MGGVAVLNPHDCLKDAFGREKLMTPGYGKKPRSPGGNTARASRTQPGRRRRSPSRGNTAPAPKSAPPKNLVMGQVKILKRGDLMSEAVAVKVDRAERDLCLTERPIPAPVEGKIMFYAGPSALIASPPPSSVPLPAFFTKKGVTVKNEDVASDLRRILRLDLS